MTETGNLSFGALRRLDRANAAGYFIDRHLEAGRGGRTAFLFQDQRISYEAFAAEVYRAGAYFSAHGVRIEDRVVVILPDCPLFVACIFAAMRTGAVPVPVSNRLSASDYVYIIADCRPRAVVVDEAHAAIVREIRERVGYPEHIWVTADQGQSAQGFEADLAACAPECPLQPTNRDDMALIQYTSGSTGAPKGVVHLHGALLEVCAPIERQLGFNDSDVFFSAAKLSAGYGFGNSALFPLSLGAGALLFPGPVDPYAAYTQIETMRPTVFCGVPSLFAAMMDVPDCATRYDLSSLRRCISAGERLSGALFERWKRTLGLELLDAIGSTECLHVFITNRPGDATPGQTGVPVSGVEVRIVDDDDRPLADGKTGHLEIRSPANAARYWNKQAATRKTMRGAWTRTGDLFTRDADGVYTFVGRADDIILVHGQKIAPSEIEECLMRHDSVMECAVIGVSDAMGITSIFAYVRPKEEHQPDDALGRQLKKHVRLSLAGYKCPQKILFVEDFPRTSSGKLARFRLRERHQAEPSARDA